MIEAHEDSNGSRHWKYACAESSIYELEAFLDGTSVWKKPRAKIFDQLNFTHFAGSYIPQPDEISIEGAVP